MGLHLDHVVVRVRDLDRARAEWSRLGLVATDTGRHPARGTRNAIIRFPDRSFLELITLADREAMARNAPERLAQYEGGPEGAVNWAVRADDLDAEHARLRDLGFPVTAIVDGEGRRDSGKVARWRRFAISEPLFPFVVTYDGPPTSEPSPAGLPASGLARMIVRAPDARRLAGRFREAFGDLAIEVRESPEPWLVGAALRLSSALYVEELPLVPPSGGGEPAR